MIYANQHSHVPSFHLYFFVCAVTFSLMNFFALEKCIAVVLAMVNHYFTSSLLFTTRMFTVTICFIRCVKNLLVNLQATTTILWYHHKMLHVTLFHWYWIIFQNLVWCVSCQLYSYSISKMFASGLIFRLYLPDKLVSFTFLSHCFLRVHIIPPEYHNNQQIQIELFL